MLWTIIIENEKGRMCRRRPAPSGSGGVDPEREAWLSVEIVNQEGSGAVVESVRDSSASRARMWSRGTVRGERLLVMRDLRR